MTLLYQNLCNKYNGVCYRLENLLTTTAECPDKGGGPYLNFTLSQYDETKLKHHKSCLGTRSDMPP